MPNTDVICTNVLVTNDDDADDDYGGGGGSSNSSLYSLVLSFSFSFLSQ